MESAKTPKIATFPADGRIWRLNWIAGMHPNPDATSDPLLDLVLERMPETFDGSLPWSRARHKGEGVFTTVQVGLGSLPGLTIGGLWRDGEQLSTPSYPLRTLNYLRFDRDGMRLMKTGALLDDGPPRNYLIPPFIHPVHTKDALKTWCLVLAHAGNPVTERPRKTSSSPRTRTRGKPPSSHHSREGTDPFLLLRINAYGENAVDHLPPGFHGCFDEHGW